MISTKELACSVATTCTACIRNLTAASPSAISTKTNSVVTSRRLSAQKLTLPLHCCVVLLVASIDKCINVRSVQKNWRMVRRHAHHPLDGHGHTNCDVWISL